MSTMLRQELAPVLMAQKQRPHNYKCMKRRVHGKIFSEDRRFRCLSQLMIKANETLPADVFIKGKAKLNRDAVVRRLLVIKRHFSLLYLISEHV